jgi:teichuronic acid biosynthesis glycosyltransferase TuaH
MRFLGPVDYEFLPSYIQHADIAILPLSDHPANDGRSPMKLYEYFASGLPVIARATSELSRRKLEYCYLYENNGDCVSHVRNIFSSKIVTDSCQAVAAAMSWDSIAQKILLYSSK